MEGPIAVVSPGSSSAGHLGRRRKGRGARRARGRSPGSGTIIGLVVRKGLLLQRDVVVPIEAVADATEKLVRLRLSADELNRLPSIAMPTSRARRPTGARRRGRRRRTRCSACGAGRPRRAATSAGRQRRWPGRRLADPGRTASRLPRGRGRAARARARRRGGGPCHRLRRARRRAAQPRAHDRARGLDPVDQPLPHLRRRGPRAA